MILRQSFLLLLSTLALSCTTNPNLQRPLRADPVISYSDIPTSTNTRTLQGKFLHITGMLYATLIRPIHPLTSA